MNDRSDARIAAWLALFLFSIYLLTYSGRLYSQDSMAMFAVTESVFKRGDLYIDQLWTLMKARNEITAAGEAFAKYGYGASLFALPLYALAFFLQLGLFQTAVLSSAIVIALAGALVFLAARALNYARGVSAITALLFGVATPAFVYAKQFWSEPYALFCLIAAFYFLQRYRARGNARDALVAGIALGLGVATRVSNLALVPFYAWYAFGDHWRDARVRRAFRAFIFALAPILFSIGAYQWARLGNPFATGYRADETFDTPVLLGVYGLLFSPGKGLFVYAPFLAALAWAGAEFFRRARRETILILSLAAIYLAIFAPWYYWWGGTNWGPRFLVPLLPFLVLLIAPAIEFALTRRNKLFTAIFGALCFLSFSFALVGISVPSLAYRLRMLRLSPNPDYDAIFLPEFSPLIGSLQQMRPRVLDFGWIALEGDGARVDWLALALGVAFCVFCAVMLMRALRAQTSRRAAFVACALVIALALFIVARARDDARGGGTDGERALLQTLEQRADARDVVILNNDTRAPFWLNENRARARWYGLSRDPQQFDDATRALLARLTRDYSRLWFAFDDGAADAPDPTREWLLQNLRVLEQYDFDGGAHLILFQLP